MIQCHLGTVRVVRGIALFVRKFRLQPVWMPPPKALRADDHLDVGGLAEIGPCRHQHVHPGRCDSLRVFTGHASGGEHLNGGVDGLDPAYRFFKIRTGKTFALDGIDARACQQEASSGVATSAPSFCSGNALRHSDTRAANPSSRP